MATVASCSGATPAGDSTPRPGDGDGSCSCPPAGWWHEAEDWTAAASGAEELQVNWVGEEGVTGTPGATRGVEGCLSRAELVAAMGERIDTVVNCLVEAARGRTSSGRVVITFTILPDGSTCGVAMSGSTVLPLEAESCVVRAACDWTWPETTEPLIVAYPIFLEGE